MSDPQIFQFPRAYFGTLADPQHPGSGAPRIIAQTPDITQAQVAESVRLAKLPPPSPAESMVEMPGALGLFRGETVDFILAKAQYNDVGVPQVLYILVPLSSLRQLGGNVLTFWSLGMMDMPSFTTTRNNLAPFEIRTPPPASPEEQSDAMMDILLYCQDSFKTVEGILAALVQGWPLAIVNSPPSLEKRLRFVQGLLSLLPVPARVGITFATHVHDPLAVNAQIKFVSDHATPGQHLIYDWGNGTLLTPAPDDSYSRYMVAQLRLDPSLVVEQTAQLSRTAVWRAMHRENLGNALAWVSRRAAVDQAVRENQPADRETVAAILREDPTLPDDLRKIYVRHLLAFALALHEPESADVVPTVCVTNADIAQAVIEQLRVALQNDQAEIVYQLLERWLIRVPEASALQWHTLLQGAAKFRLQELLKRGQAQPAMRFINHVQQSPPSLRLKDVTPDLIRMSFQAARANSKLAQLVFLTAVDVLPAGELYRILGDAQFAQHLPKPLQTALAYLQPEPCHPVPDHVLAQGASAFGKEHQVLVLVRLAEWAIYLERAELIDTQVLQALLSITQTDQHGRFHGLIQQVVDDLGVEDTIHTLEPPGIRLLLQLLLQIEDFERTALQLEYYQQTVFGSERLLEFTRLAGEVFQQAKLPPHKLTEALNHLEGTQIRPEPRAMIFCGVLINQQWASTQDFAARRLTTMIFNDHNLISIIGPDNTLQLLEFHARSKNALDTLRVAAAMVDHTLPQGQDGARLLLKMWPIITWDAEVTDAAFELIRRFVRGAHRQQVPDLIAYFERELGPEIGTALHATQLMCSVLGKSDMMVFAEELHTTHRLLLDLAAVYHADKEQPPLHRLRHELDTMPGGLTEDERQQIADNVLNIARQIYELGQQSTRRRGRKPSEEQLAQGKAVPHNGLELLFFIGGHFAHHAYLTLDLDREEMGHIFGTRSAGMLLRETNQITRLFDGLLGAFNQVTGGDLTVHDLAAELDSLWGTLSLFNQRQNRAPLAEHCQQLAGVIRIMADNANERVLSNGGVGRQLESGKRQPQTSLESLRWVQGYFGRKHRR